MISVLPLIFLALMPFVVSKCAFRLSDILPDGRVILLPPPDNSVIEFYGFSVILFALKLAESE